MINIYVAHPPKSALTDCSTRKNSQVRRRSVKRLRPKPSATPARLAPRQIPLDNALRYLYDTLRNIGIGMAIEFKHAGRTWRADTPEEAIALRRQLEEADDFSAWLENPVDSLPKSAWTHDAVMELLQALGPQQQSFLRTLLELGKLTSDEIRRALHLESEIALAGVISGLSKQAKKAGFAPSDLYSVSVSWSGKDKTRTFELSEQFGRAAEELGWPKAWRQDKK